MAVKIFLDINCTFTENSNLRSNFTESIKFCDLTKKESRMVQFFSRYEEMKFGITFNTNNGKYFFYINVYKFTLHFT